VEVKAVEMRTFRGRTPRLGRRVFVASTAVLVGEVELGDDVSVWYGAVLRGDLMGITVGARTNVQDNVVIHVDEPEFPASVGEDVTIGHGAVLHGCRVGNGALVGMHATVLNGAVIGDGAVVAAGSLVPPGMAVPAGTMVAGVPAKVRREVTAPETEHVRRGVRSYLELKSRYLAGEDERVQGERGAQARTA
jgi:carbonic anhydrase/acetyltransferase-like protein (isoleucine patch superfamily)